MEGETLVMPDPLHYSFFDIDLACAFPDDITARWDLLYNHFRSASIDEPHIRVTVDQRDDDRYTLRVNDTVQAVSHDDVMLRLQDLIQNHVLPIVRSHVLWHGALWSVEGRGIMILGASGLGKTTLSLAHALSGGHVLSDEIAAWHPEAARMSGFPRALAVRPDSLTLLGDRRTHPHLMLDEEKAMVPLIADVAGTAVPLSAICVLQRPLDPAVHGQKALCEMQVRAPDTAWRDALQLRRPDAVLTPHPDGDDWWRCQHLGHLPTQILEEAVRGNGAVLAGFHRDARRKPVFSGPPVMEDVDHDIAVELALAELINGREWIDRMGALRLMTMVRTALRPARCVRCVPGKLEETLVAIRQLGD